MIWTPEFQRELTQKEQLVRLKRLDIVRLKTKIQYLKDNPNYDNWEERQISILIDEIEEETYALRILETDLQEFQDRVKEE